MQVLLVISVAMSLRYPFQQRKNAMREIYQALAGRRDVRCLLVLCCLLTPVGSPALAVGPTIVVAVEQKDGAFIVDASVDIEVPLATAWDVLTDFEHMPSIFENLRSSRITARDGNVLTVRQEGVAKFGFLSFAFSAEREIRLEPMHRIVTKNLSGTLKSMESEVVTTAHDHGVQLKYHAAIVPDSTLARMFGASFVRHEVEEQFLGMGREMMRRHAHLASPEKNARGLGHDVPQAQPTVSPSNN